MRSKCEHLLAFSFHKTVIFIALSHFNNKYNLALYRSIPTRVLTALQTANRSISSSHVPHLPHINLAAHYSAPGAVRGDKSLNDKSAKAPTDQD